MPRKILIVDDSKAERVILSGILEKDYYVVVTENGSEAYSALLRDPYDYSAVLADISDAAEDGCEFVRLIRQSDFTNYLPVLLIIAEASEETLATALNCGANNVITKPLNPTLLLSMLNNLISLQESSAMVNALQRDALTGVYNREAFMRETGKLIQSHEAGYYIMDSLKIDQFKAINDQYGTQMGDRVLKRLGSVFNRGMDAIGGICCRTSNDRFAAVYPAELENSETIENILSEAACVEGLSVPVSYYIGRYYISDLSLSPGIMYDRAELAGETIKDRYETRIAYYEDSLRESLIVAQSIVSDMERALAAGEFEPWFQPQHNHSTGALIGSEALVRWRKSDGIIPPADFIPVFEKNGFIYQVDKSVWRQVCAQLRRWLDEGRSPLPVSVNISRYDLFQHDFYDCICGLIGEYALPAELLRLEITESAFSESPQQIIEIVTKLVDFGFIVEIDDFGSGYSSLNTLKDVPAQVLKLDMRFFQSGNSLRGGNIVESIVRMAKWLGMAVIAEGIEKNTQADYLRSIGCDYIQGFLYARPMPAEQFELHCECFDREKKLSALETLENLDHNSFWDPASMDTLIFNSYVGSACILEYTKGRIEMLRATRHYIEMLGNSEMTIADALGLDWGTLLDEQSNLLFAEAVRQSKEKRETVYGEFVFIDIPGCPHKTVIRGGVRVIATSGDRWLVYCISENITAQYEAVRKEQQLFSEMQTMLADMPGGFTRMREKPDGTYEGVFCNAGFCELVGMEHDALIDSYSKKPIDHIHPDDADIVRRFVAEIQLYGEARSARYRLLTASGAYVWVSVVGRFTWDTEGNSFLNLYYNDETLREKQARQREMLMDNLPWGAGMYSFRDGQMGLIYQNKSYWELVGLHGDKFPDPAPMSAIHPDDIPLIMQKLALAIEHNEYAICDVRLRNLKLGYRRVRIVARIVADEVGGYLIIATFIPNEQVEMSYRQMFPLVLSAMMEATSDYAFAKDKDFRYICCSPSFVQLTGLENSRDVVGKSDFELFAADAAEQFRRNDVALLESGRSMVDFDETITLRDGTPHYCRASKHLLRDDAGEIIGIYGVSRDITKERSALEQLQLVNDGIPGGIATYSFKDGALRIVYCNDGFCRLFDETRENVEALGDYDPMDWVFEEDRAERMRQLRDLEENNIPIDIVYRIRTLSGVIKWINQKSSTVERRADSVRFNAILLDITDRQMATERLRISEEENSLAIRHSGNMICRFDIARRELTLSSDIAAKHSLPETVTDVPYEPVRLGVIAPESVDAYIGFFEAIINGSRSETAVFQQHYLEDWRWVEAKSTTVFSDDGKPVKAVISIFDVTDRLEQETIFKKWQLSMEERAEASYTLFRCNLNRNSSFEVKNGSLYYFDVDAVGGSFNDRSRVYAEQCIYHEDRERYIAFMDSDALLAGYYRGRRSDTLEYRELAPESVAYRWLRLTVDLAEYPNSADVEAYLMYENIDDIKQAELEAKARSENDPLTGILNRSTFEARVRESLRLTQQNTTHALLMLDLDGFKLVNDIFGHGAGDGTLIDVAAQLKKSIRRDDYVGRLGGDEFVVFLNDIPNEKIAAMKAQQICELSKKDFSVEVQISGSVGIALYPADGKDFDTLYKKADLALYYVKGSGKNNFAFYHDDIDGSDTAERGAAALRKLDIKRRMLIVDDSRLDCELLANVFKEDFRVDVVYDGASALTKIHHYGVALSIVLLDLHMPGMNGYSVLERMQRDAGMRGVPVIVISGSDDRETLLKVIGTGASDLIAKPIDPDILRIRVNSAISKVENERLRAQNSLLTMLNDEISSYQSVLEQLGMAVAVNYWIHGNYMYSPSMSEMFSGNYDSRRLWHILLSDTVADTLTVQRMQHLVHKIANDRELTKGRMTATLKSKDGSKRKYEVNVFKQTNEYGLTERMILAFREAAE